MGGVQHAAAPGRPDRRADRLAAGLDPDQGSVLLVAGVIAAIGALFYVLRTHWRIVLSAILGAAALGLLMGNLGDLRHGWLRGPGAHEEGE